MRPINEFFSVRTEVVQQMPLVGAKYDNFIWSEIKVHGSRGESIVYMPYLKSDPFPTGEFTQKMVEDFMDEVKKVVVDGLFNKEYTPLMRSELENKLEI